jgi:hypothetical protein
VDSFRGRTAAAGVVLFLWPFHATAAIYRCTSPGKPDSYQSTPCESGKAQAVVPNQDGQSDSDVRVQPRSGLSREQRAAYDGLLTDYYEMFGVLGRAKTCGLDPNRLQQTAQDVIGRLERRHGKDDSQDVLKMMVLGVTAGAENRKSGLEKPNVTPPGEIPCADALRRAQNLRLPVVPASLVIPSGDQPITTQIAELSASTGAVRIVKKEVGQEASASHNRSSDGGIRESHYLVLHRNRQVFDSSREIDVNRLMEGKVPALLLGIVDPDAHCYDPGAKVNLHFTVITLPETGATDITPFNFHCMSPDVYRKYNTNYICFRDNTQARRQSEVFRIDETGKPVFFGRYNWQACPTAEPVAPRAGSRSGP